MEGSYNGFPTATAATSTIHHHHHHHYYHHQLTRIVLINTFQLDSPTYTTFKLLYETAERDATFATTISDSAYPDSFSSNPFFLYHSQSHLFVNRRQRLRIGVER